MNKFTIKNILKNLFEVVIVLVIMVWAVAIYLLDGSPDKMEIREFNQSNDGPSLSQYEVENILGWHSPITHSQWWYLILAGAIVIVGCIWLYQKWRDRYLPASSTIANPSLELWFQSSFFIVYFLMKKPSRRGFFLISLNSIFLSKLYCVVRIWFTHYIK